MIGLINKLFWRFISILLLITIGIVIYQWSLHGWTGEDIYDFFIDVLKYGIPSVLITYIIYKTYIERIILWWNRRKSAEVIAEELNQINQVSGAVRSGKDASTVGASIIVKEYIGRKEKKQLQKYTYDLYIYDFKLINAWLDKNGFKFFVASEHRINKVFSSMIRNNKCFINDYWIKRGINPDKHYKTWKYSKQKNYIPDVAFNDGLTAGGVHYLELLKKYVLLYMYYHYVPNFIMSNQPVLEAWTVIKKTGKIKHTFSKKLSQDYFKLKEDTPIPFPMRGFIIETETAIFYSNTDKKLENYVKDESGIREFYTTAGHILREKVFLYGITQSATRTMKVLRELYPGYQHIFKMKFRATSDFTRSIIKFRSTLKKFKMIRTRFYRWIQIKLIKLTRVRPNNPRRVIALQLIEDRYLSKIQRLRRKISKLSQKDLQKWAKGYIIFYKGIYENIADVGKRVKFPTFGVIQESKTNTTTYQTFGFKQTNRIKDSFGRYDTHFMKSVREAKEILYDLHFTDVPSWEGFNVTFEDIDFMNYDTFKAMMSVVIRMLEKEETETKKRLKAEQQRRKKMGLPNFIKLDDQELLNLMKDFGINESKVDKSSDTYRADIMKLLAQEYKSFYLEKEKLI